MTIAAPSPADEAALVRAARAGDEAAFTRLYRRYGGPLYRFALRMGGSEALAEDALQEAFVALLPGTPSGYDPGRGALVSYLFGVVRNQVARRLRREREALDPDDGESIADEASIDALEALDRQQRIAALRAAVDALPPALREVVALCDLEDLSYEEAAGALAVPIGTVRSRLHRARARIAAILSSTALPCRKEALP